MTDDGVIAAKKAVRRRILALRDALSDAERAQKSQEITARIAGLAVFGDASTVAAYASFGTEFDSSALIEAVLSNGAHLLLPRVDREQKRIDFFSVTDPAVSLVPGQWGIPEPDPARCDRVDAQEIDFMLVPGVAFTARCERLGYGGGYYDGAIGRLRRDAIKVAAAFSLQVIDELPMELHDRRVDVIVTEDASYCRED
ncbi:MAG: 5-formyltetrahydrofolate cyclo-ligase [Burkholderiales bacterium]|jgi:5-formyltetrahydrofolate cyclo-ligase